MQFRQRLCSYCKFVLLWHLEKFYYFIADIENYNINIDINYFRGIADRPLRDSPPYVFSSNVLLPWRCYSMAQTASLCNGVEISSSHIPDNMYPYWNLSHSSHVTFNFSSSISFFALLYIPYSFLFVYINMRAQLMYLNKWPSAHCWLRLWTCSCSINFVRKVLMGSKWSFYGFSDAFRTVISFRLRYIDKGGAQGDEATDPTRRVEVQTAQWSSIAGAGHNSDALNVPCCSAVPKFELGETCVGIRLDRLFNAQGTWFKMQNRPHSLQRIVDNRGQK